MAASKIVTVTGATGFVGGHAIKILLEKGYNVRGTVRNAKNKDRTKHLFAIADKTPGNLKLYEADLSNEGSFEEAIDGADAVLHIASPVTMTAQNPEEEIVKPAIQGALNVLRTCKKVGSVKKVVMTSSVAAVRWAGKEPSGTPAVFTEKDWNTVSTISTEPYPVSKVKAEQAAWDFVKEDKSFSLVTICPSFILGPVLSPGRLSESLSAVKSLITGGYPRVPDMYFGITDVRDVAMAHIISMEKAEIQNERYICSRNGLVAMLDLSKALKKLYPKQPIPMNTMPNFAMYAAAIFDKRLSWNYLNNTLGKKYHYNNEKIVSELGIQFKDMDTSLRDSIEAMAEHGHFELK